MDKERFLTFCLWTHSSFKDMAFAEQIARIVLPWDDKLPATALFAGPLTKDRNERFGGDGDRFIECLTSPHSNYVVLTNQGRRKPPTLFGLTFMMPGDENIITLNVEHEYFLLEGALDRYTKLVIGLINVTNPIYGCVHDLGEYVESTGMVSIDEQIPGVFLGQFFRY